MDNAVCTIQRCIEDIRIWRRENVLKLHDEKPEIFVFGSRQQMYKITIPGVRIGDSLISSGMFDTYNYVYEDSN